MYIIINIYDLDMIKIISNFTSFYYFLRPYFLDLIDKSIIIMEMLLLNYYLYIHCI